MEERVDLVVIGAGWSGLAAAKTYLEVNPGNKLVVVESASSVGGTWQESRIYPRLKANNILGEYEYPQFPMREHVYGIRPDEHIPGLVIHRYLTDFAKAFGIFPLIRLNTKVMKVENTADGGWSLELVKDGVCTKISTAKLIIATGLTSRPSMPDLPGAETFEGPILHSREFGKQFPRLANAKQVFVLGGGKSAFDMAYALAEADVQVDLMIRRSGHGPVWLAPPFLTPWKLSLGKLLHTRLLTWLSPCVWGQEDGYVKTRRFLHESWLGRTLCDFAWSVLGFGRDESDGYKGCADTEKLRPWDKVGLMGTASSVNNYPTDFFDMVRNGKIRIHVAEISRLEEGAVCFDSGQVVRADALICATGWKKEPSFMFDDDTARKLGLQQSSESSTLSKFAESEILEQFPQIRHNLDNSRTKQLLEDKDRQGDTPTMQLYRFMIPPVNINARNLAFVGMVSSISPAICASLQALWICAYFDGQLQRLPHSQGDVKWLTALHSSFSKLEHPTGYGTAFPDLVLDNLPYYDMLLRDLGLSPHRKASWWKEAVEAYGPTDYASVVREWVAEHPHGSFEKSST